ncbi:hypothetical protein [Streptomyces sp. TP-A0874]|uniref:hypothetical protein n=1 Tax=Streptomyces sp. TP-A0874 TaxID=549819 RepID=UPI000853402F|nr:hypothetical protein [Streptomyces sp. TP-A0874]
MSGKVIHAGTQIGCPHGGRAGTAPTPSRGVLLDGRTAVNDSVVHTVTGCPHTVDGVPTPCTSIRWSPPTDSVRVDGAPVVLETTPALCYTAGLVPQGPPVVSSVTPRGVVCG